MDAAEAGTAVKLEALIVDWGGVLTSPLDQAMSSWAEADGVDFAHFADVMRVWVGARGSGPVASGGAGAEDANAAVGGAEDAAVPGGVEEADAVGGSAGDVSGPGGAGNAKAADGGAVDGGGAEDAIAGGGGAEGASAGGGAEGGNAVGGGAEGAGAGGGGAEGASAGYGDEGGVDAGVLGDLGAAADAGVVPASPVHALERGEIGVPEFERRLAAALAERGSPVPAEGLLGRVLGGLEELRDDMLGLVRRARRSGLRTALLSNSWGDNYPEHAWEGAFDVVVISGRVGMRKPDQDIFRHTADLLGVLPQACVMVDDLAHNVRGAVAAGMVGVLHESYERTAEELEILFDRPLR